MSKEKQLDQLFARAKKAPAVVSFEETKSEFIKSSSVLNTRSFFSKLKDLFNIKNGIIMISIVSILSIGIMLLWSNPTNDNPTKKNVKQQEQSSVLIDYQHVQKQDETRLKSEELNKKNTPQVHSMEVQGLEQRFERNIQLSTSLVSLKQVKSAVDSNYLFRFPTLTKDEIAANIKQKKKMIKALAKFDKKFYSYVPSGSFDYNGKIVSIQSFWIQQDEVTNLEYRTFLFDLIIQNKRDDFFTACPDQTQWVKVLGEGVMPMQDTYFSHEGFNDYPVVNISRKGAELFCKWLTDETNATLNENQKIEKVRIPTRVEWVKAASSDGKYLPFPWGTVVNKDGVDCYLANFDASTYPSQSKLPMDFAGDGALYTAKTRTYNPNEYGLYNMSGNVAEMVNEMENKENDLKSNWSGYGTAGGSWMNTVEEIKINGPDPYPGVEKPHPAIGFRVVVSYMNGK